MMSFTRFEEGVFKPMTLISPVPALSSADSLVLKLKLGASTCSINNEAVMAFSILLTDSFTRSSAASGWAIKLVNWASVSYTHLRAHETRHDLVCRLLLEKKKK